MSKSQNAFPVELGTQKFEDNRATALMEELRLKLAPFVGVTVVGPNLAIRYRRGDNLVQVSLRVTSITDSSVMEQLDEEDK